MSKSQVVILGCGLIGSVIALDYLESSLVSKVTVVDISGERLRALQQHASNVSGIDPVSGTNLKLDEKLQTVELDTVKHRDDLVKLL
jgi:saccharopine dehydrogenase-like NADP-dependent oxidoreductase